MKVHNDARIDALSVVFAALLMAATVAGGIAAFALGFAEAGSARPLVEGSTLASL